MLTLFYTMLTLYYTTPARPRLTRDNHVELLDSPRGVPRQLLLELARARTARRGLLVGHASVSHLQYNRSAVMLVRTIGVQYNVSVTGY